MAITARVKSQYFQKDKGLIRLAPSQDHLIPTKRAGTPWTPHEHNLFLEALEHYPSGPWKIIAAYIGTRTTRQTMTHAQKYREKIARRQKAKDAAGNANEVTRIEVISPKVQIAPSNQPVVSSPTQVQDIKLEEDVTSNPFMELLLDDSVITLLETVDMVPMSLSTYSSVTTTLKTNCESPADSPFQQCIPL